MPPNRTRGSKGTAAQNNNKTNEKNVQNQQKKFLLEDDVPQDRTQVLVPARPVTVMAAKDTQQNLKSSGNGQRQPKYDKSQYEISAKEGLAKASSALAGESHSADQVASMVDTN